MTQLILFIALVLIAYLLYRGRAEAKSDLQPGTASSHELERRVSLLNAAIESFDSAADIDVKRSHLPVIERELEAVLRLAPANQGALLLKAMLPEKKAALDAAAASSHQHYAEAPSIDEMRAGLQKVAYGMVGKGVRAEDKARFKQDMTEFASVDPLVHEIAKRVQRLVAESPGLLQSKIYGHFPEYDKEQVRYALYFAHELGLIHRKKRGSSYQLFPAGRIIDA